jgi:D-alanyl-D-alanine dipeptidase
LPDGFVYIKDVIPSIELELRYYGHRNFIGRPIDGYNQEKGIVTEKAAKALKIIQKKLKKEHLGLKIYDAYRPQKAVDHFARWAKNLNDTLNKHEYYPNVKKANLFKEEYIAYRSGHSRGSTVDLTIIDLSTPEKRELDMGSSYDFFGQESWVSYDKLSDEQLSNRLFIQELMKKNNFKNYMQEWWHFTLKNEPFPNTYFNFSIE